MLFSKKEVGRHAEEGEIEAMVEDYIKQYAAEHGLNVPEFN